MMLQHSASERGIRNLDITWKNIVTDYGAVGDGSTNDYTAFKAFYDWAKLESGWVGLVIPPSSGHYRAAGSYAPASAGPFMGIPKLIVMGYGASIDTIHGGALLNNNTKRAAVNSVALGATTVELKDVDDASKFSEGGMILIAGLDMQNGFGYPPNPHFFEWNRIVDISGAVITLENPTINAYEDDWPRFSEGSAFELGGFGPATICAAIAEWDCEQRIYGLTEVGSGQSYAFARKSWLFDVNQPNEGFIIGASEDMRIINQTHTASSHEVDKLTVNGLIAEYGPSNRSISIQSSSVQFLHVRGGTRSIVGTAKRMLITGGSRSSITLGPIAYGISEQITVRDAEITTGFTGGSGLSKALGDNLTYEGDGIFRCVDPGIGSNYWFIPGAVGTIGTNTPFFAHSPFRITDVWSEDGEQFGATLIQTTLTGPDLPVVDGQTNAGINRHPGQDLTVENCTGCPEALELSLAPPSSPYGMFRRRTFDGLSAANSLGFVMGRLVHIKVNVVTPYTGSAGTLNLTLGGQFGTWLLHPDWTQTRPQTSRINLKVAGERVITPSGVTGTQTGDTNLSAFAVADVWMPNNFGFGVYIGNGSSAVDISGEDPSVRPSVTVEILTDQEIPDAP
jgi:hypothetical protein